MKIHLPVLLRYALLSALIQTTPASFGDWLWSGGSATWSDTSSAGWSDTGGGEPAGQNVSFGAEHDGVVTIDRVSPASITVLGGEYSFVSASAESVGIVSSGDFSISGDATVLNLNLGNQQFTGNVELQGGTLQLGAPQALGAAPLVFNGGMLRYGSGIDVDVSGQIHALSSAPVRVDTNGNEVVWGNSSGVKQALQLGVVKNGEGSLQLSWTAAGETHAGSLQVNGGSLSVSKGSGRAVLAGGFSGSGEISFSSPSGQLTVQGDNSAFTGTVLLEGDGAPNTGSVSFATGASLGGSSTLVQLAGQRFWFGTNTTTAVQLEILDGTTTYLDGSTGYSYGFTGSVGGGGTVILKPSAAITMSGDISSFNGMFTHPGNSAVSWQLGGENVAGSGLVQANLNAVGGNMNYVLWYSAPTILSGNVTGAANLRQRGTGTLTLTGQNTSTGRLIIDAGCEVQLGSATTPGTWAGAIQQGAGMFTLVNGALAQPLTAVAGGLEASVAAGGSVDMAGTAADLLQNVSIDTAGQLRGLNGDLSIGGNGGATSLSLSLGAANVGGEAVPAQGKQTMLVQRDGSLVINDSADVYLDTEAVKTILQGQRQAVYLHISNSDIVLQNGVTAASLFTNSATTPEALGLVVLGVEGGNIVLEGAVVDVYMVAENGDYPTVTSYSRLQDYKAAYVDAGYTLSLQLAGDDTQAAWVNNLLGTGDFSVSNTDEASGIVRVLLNNEVLGEVDSSLTPDEEAEINTANTLFSGSVTAGSAVQLVKTGSGSLSLGGVLTTPWLELDEGLLRLTGQGSVVQRLLGNAALELAAGSSLEIEADSLAFTGNLSGTGELVLNGALPGRGRVGALSGSGSLQAVGDTFTVSNVQNSTFSGSLAGDAPSTLLIAAGSGQFTLNQVQGTAAWSLQNQGSLTLQQQGADNTNAVLTLGTLGLNAGSSTTLVWNTDADNQVLNLGGLVVAEDANLTLRSTSPLPVQLRADGTLVLGTVQSAELGADTRAMVTLAGGAAFRGIESAWLSVQDGYLLLNTVMSNYNPYAAAAASPNARTGAVLLWNLPAGVLADSPDLSALADGIDQMLDSGDVAGADELMAAAAGAGAAVLADAVSGDMERQLKSIRNRTIEMGLAPGYEYDGQPYFNAWVAAEGDHRELQADGTDSGYSLSSWGVTLGADMDFSRSFTAGLAITAMYGDFDGRSPDHASGNMDSYYLTLFGKYNHRRWKHTWIAALGWSDLHLERHVTYGSGSCHTKGDTSGMGGGLLYELGYDIPLHTVSPVLMQPVFNISYRHAGIDAYREHGSDAALRFSKQDMDVVTFGLGLRVYTSAFESVYNRSCPVYTRFLVKADAGDIRSHANSSLLALPERSGRVRSAENHRLGLEMGIGITIPIGESSGSLFMDCSYDCRFDESEVNGTVGYRLSF
ncbi:MAG: autotransporter domain-containing protein [Akkermansia sp.]|nr:autotransporter domain-containing protein [Akkermansia sp.]